MNQIMMFAFYDELQKIAAEEEKKPMSALKRSLIGAGIGLGGGLLVGGIHGALSGAAKGRRRAAKELERSLASEEVGRLYLVPGATRGCRARALAKREEIAARLPNELATARRLRSRAPNFEEAARRDEVLQRQLAKEQKIKKLPTTSPRQVEERAERLFQARLAREKAQAAAGRAYEWPEGLKRKLEKQHHRIQSSAEDQKLVAGLETAKARILSEAPKREAILAKHYAGVKGQDWAVGGAAAGGTLGAGAGLATGLLRRKKEQQ